MHAFAPIDVQPDTRSAGELRGNFKSVIEDLTGHPGRVQRFGRQRKAEVVVMSDETLQSILQRLRVLEHDVLVAQTRSVMEQGYEPVDPADVEGEHLARAQRALGIA